MIANSNGAILYTAGNIYIVSINVGSINIHYNYLTFAYHIRTYHWCDVLVTKQYILPVFVISGILLTNTCHGQTGGNTWSDIEYTHSVDHGLL